MDCLNYSRGLRSKKFRIHPYGQQKPTNGNCLPILQKVSRFARARMVFVHYKSDWIGNLAVLDDFNCRIVRAGNHVQFACHY
jgi:hypothetical protein